MSSSNAAYQMLEHQWIAPAIVDWKWTATDEWNDDPPMTMPSSQKTAKEKSRS